MAEAKVFKTNIKLIKDICMLNSYLKTKQRLSGWRRNQIATLDDVKKTCKLEVKGLLKVALVSPLRDSA